MERRANTLLLIIYRRRNYTVQIYATCSFIQVVKIRIDNNNIPIFDSNGCSTLRFGNEIFVKVIRLSLLATPYHFNGKASFLYSKSFIEIRNG